MKHSAGILLYRRVNTFPEVLLVHPGGPFFRNKDEGAWSIPKGEFDPASEDALEVAKREFEEETGNIITTTEFSALRLCKTRGGKLIHCWAAEENIDPCFIASNTFEIQWPPGSGRLQRFPETDKAEWFRLEEARRKINTSQIPLIEELAQGLVQP